MHMDGDERLKLGPLHFGQIPGGLGNQHVQQSQEWIVGTGHDLAVIFGMG